MCSQGVLHEPQWLARNKCEQMAVVTFPRSPRSRPAYRICPDLLGTWNSVRCRTFTSKTWRGSKKCRQMAILLSDGESSPPRHAQ
jgi:hypothetical protein